MRTNSVQTIVTLGGFNYDGTIIHLVVISSTENARLGD